MMLPDEYEYWLCSTVLTSESDLDIYKPLLDILATIEFTWSIPNDDNRAHDGQHLRYVYAEESYDHAYMKFSLPCSVLEMMVALAHRIDDDIMYEAEYGDRTSEWFWVMIRNLGLECATEEELRYDGKYGEAYVRHVIDVFMNRTYCKDGRGGLFPVKNVRTDQRKVEIWYQMNQFLIENCACL